MTKFSKHSPYWGNQAPQISTFHDYASIIYNIIIILGQRWLQSYSLVIHGWSIKLATEYHCIQCIIIGYTTHVCCRLSIETNFCDSYIVACARQSSDMDEYVWNVPGNSRCTVLQSGEWYSRKLFLLFWIEHLN